MDVVIGDIPGDHQADGWDMQAGRVVSVTMPDFYDDQVVPFEIDHLSLELLGDHELVRDLAWKPRTPEARDEHGLGLLAHAFHHSGRGDCSGMREAIQESSEAKEMVAMTVGEIDRGKVLALRFAPIHHGACLLDGDHPIYPPPVPPPKPNRPHFHPPH